MFSDVDVIVHSWLWLSIFSIHFGFVCLYQSYIEIIIIETSNWNYSQYCQNLRIDRQDFYQCKEQYPITWCWGTSSSLIVWTRIHSTWNFHFFLCYLTSFSVPLCWSHIEFPLESSKTITPRITVADPTHNSYRISYHSPKNTTWNKTMQ